MERSTAPTVCTALKLFVMDVVKLAEALLIVKYSLID
jgi:hypothetical protein